MKKSRLPETLTTLLHKALLFVPVAALLINTLAQKAWAADKGT